MGIGEEIPALIPISIAIVFLTISFSMLFVTYYEKSDLLSMHSFAMTSLEKQVYLNRGIFNETYLDSNDLSIKSNKYKTMLEITNFEKTKKWNYSYVSEPDLIVSFPCLIKNSTAIYKGFISLSVKK